MASIVIFLITCTFIEIKQNRSSAGHCKLNDTLAMFSLRKSVASIFNVEVKKGTLPALDGIRSICMLLIILYHQYKLTAGKALLNTLDYYEVNNRCFFGEYMVIYMKKA